MEILESPSFAELLNRYRVAAKLTQEELAERAGVSVRSISNMERQAPHTPREETVRLLAAALNLSPVDTAVFLAMARDRGDSAAVSAARRLRDAPSNNLPTCPTPLIGREREIAAACDLLRTDVRLLTLVGPAGVGKTRLALELATQLAHVFADGVFFVDLALFSEPEHTFVAIARAIGVSERGSEPLRERVLAYLRTRHALLLLDNFEHLAAAAPLVASLMTSCPQIRVLVTSRAAVHVRSEYEFAVAPLALPDLANLPPTEALAQNPAVALFLARAQQIRADFALTPDNAATVAAICQRLDGLPLAIELAAARIKLLSPQVLLSRLEHRLQILVSGPLDLPVRKQA
ncbi:MAG: ATP-binding protein, partial [Ktedonobacterales bacterium]